MYNDHISHEEANELIRQRAEEAESYSRQKQLGFGDTPVARWAFVLAVILAATAVGLLL
jgi:hypothetical protein